MWRWGDYVRRNPSRMQDACRCCSDPSVQQSEITPAVAIHVVLWYIRKGSKAPDGLPLM